MSLYYEDFPADDGAEPQLPPLLTAVKVPSGQNVMAKALASGATAEVGTVFYGEDTDVTDIALVLGPEVPLRKAGQMLYAMMIGVGDAIGALALSGSPPIRRPGARICRPGWSSASGSIWLCGPATRMSGVTKAALNTPRLPRRAPVSFPAHA